MISKVPLSSPSEFLFLFFLSLSGLSAPPFYSLSPPKQCRYSSDGRRNALFFLHSRATWSETLKKNPFWHFPPTKYSNTIGPLFFFSSSFLPPCSGFLQFLFPFFLMVSFFCFLPFLYHVVESSQCTLLNRRKAVPSIHVFGDLNGRAAPNVGPDDSPPNFVFVMRPDNVVRGLVANSVFFSLLFHIHNVCHGIAGFHPFPFLFPFS